MTENEILVLGRVLERLIIVLAAGASIWMGWRLFYRVADRADHEAELSWKELRVQLQRVGPGAFFALFGVVVLVTALLRPLTFTIAGAAEAEAATSTSYNVPRALRADLDEHLRALNTLIVVGRTPRDVPIAGRDRALLVRAAERAVDLKVELLRLRFGEEDFRTWAEFSEAYARNPDSVPEIVRATVAEIQGTYDGELQ
ncbi:hypothetical protein KUV62_21690 [Salipiger bermudensis]|uniref:hypothetical protein n=1 Tax=Salipiger bermudensis TaxID=344736 RepID=UPI001C997691|nr:hypothetical protein [Salipiger bermudensis]MBY6006551.1 hypothetical protein [Salipiger bermudensis]